MPVKPGVGIARGVPGPCFPMSLQLSDNKTAGMADTSIARGRAAWADRGLAGGANPVQFVIEAVDP